MKTENRLKMKLKELIESIDFERSYEDFYFTQADENGMLTYNRCDGMYYELIYIKTDDVMPASINLDYLNSLKECSACSYFRYCIKPVMTPSIDKEFIK